MITASVKSSNGALQRKLQELSKLKGRVKMGFFKDATYPDGKSVAYIAYLNEYGGHNPERPFMKTTAQKQGKKWAKGILENIKGHVTQNSVTRAFEMCGMVAEGDIKRTIKDWPNSKPRPNRESTIRRKFARSTFSATTVDIDPNAVLIDSGVMISKVRHEVEK